MVDGSGIARITDFGLASIVRDPSSVASAYDGGHTPRWTAPEILRESPASKESDVFSFAMVMFEVRGWSILDVSTTLFLNSGFFRASSVPRYRIAGSYCWHHEWEASRTAHSPQTHESLVGFN